MKKNRSRLFGHMQLQSIDEQEDRNSEFGYPKREQGRR